jgi:hypothetical protein
MDAPSAAPQGCASGGRRSSASTRQIYFSVLQRKVLTPNDFASLGELEERLFAFGERYDQVANSFEWKFTRRDLHRLLRRLREREHPLAAAA